jgi:hypothetical protein
MYAFRAIIRRPPRATVDGARRPSTPLTGCNGRGVRLARPSSAVKLVTSYPRRTFTYVFTWTGGAVACSFLTLASSLMAAR